MEAMAQTAGVLVLKSIPERESKLVLLVAIEYAKFRRPVVPGDQLRIEVDVLSFRTRAGRIEGRASVEGKLACEAILTCQVVARQAQGRGNSGEAPVQSAEAQPVGTAE